MSQAASEPSRSPPAKGFIAALDQSGGSTPKALRLYGIPETATGPRPRCSTSSTPCAHGSRAPRPSAATQVIGAILFERTMDREIAASPSARYLWKERGVVPFLKVDKGLAEPEHGVR